MTTNNNEFGTLYVCATPIGNLEDITLRVLRTLKEVDFIAAEDTRHTLKLLNHYAIQTHMTSYHAHNHREKGVVIVRRLLSGESCALVTDAGMPGISDPGEDLIRLCRESGVPVTVCPGASAGITALVLSGLPARRYCFEAFLPTDKKERAEILNALADEPRTMVFYEAPHRLCATLAALLAALGDRETAVVRELTKKHETACHGTLTEHIRLFEQTPPKGEFVVLVRGADAAAARKKEQKQWAETNLTEHVALYTAQGLSEKDAMKRAAKDRGVTKRAVYNALKRD